MQKQAGFNIQSQDDKLKKMQDAESNIHFMNINEDPILTGYVRHILKNGENKIGSKVEENQGIKMSGLGVGENHSSVFMSSGNIFIRPNANP